MSFKDLMTYIRILIRHIYTSVISWWQSTLWRSKYPESVNGWCWTLLSSRIWCKRCLCSFTSASSSFGSFADSELDEVLESAKAPCVLCCCSSQMLAPCQANTSHLSCSTIIFRETIVLVQVQCISFESGYLCAKNAYRVQRLAPFKHSTDGNIRNHWTHT